jgi:predicted GIY-YIG superfamily endonuclease
MTTTIYTLELETNKYYVGRSLIPKERILKHFQEEGSEWTKLYKPIKVLSQLKGDAFDEEKHTLIAMEKYGIDNVRGGSYCKVNLSQNDKDKALQTIRSISDKCYKCGKKGHFAKDCCEENDNYANEHEEYCKQCGWVHFPKNELCDGNYCGACHGSGESYWSDDCYGSCLECCCINCGNKRKNCICRECDKCKEIIINNEQHSCYKCEKCYEYISHDNHICELCIECGKYNGYVSVASHHRCFNCL